MIGLMQISNMSLMLNIHQGQEEGQLPDGTGSYNGMSYVKENSVKIGHLNIGLPFTSFELQNHTDT